MSVKFQATTKDAYKLFHDGSLALSRACQNGMRIDTERCQKMMTELDSKIEEQTRRLKKTELGKQWSRTYHSNMNPDNDHQLRAVLKKLDIPLANMTASGKNYSVDNESLSALDLSGVRQVVVIRKSLKAKNTYLKAIMREQVNGVLRPFINLNTVQTFRSSSNLINFQNIPKRDGEMKAMIRGCIIPRPGNQIGGVDFSGIEVSTAALYHQDPVMIKYLTDSDSDMHGDLAMQLFKLDSLDKGHSGEKNFRQGAKNGFVFPQFYGAIAKNNVPILLKWAKESKLKDNTPGLIHLSNSGMIKLDKHGKVKNFDKFEKHVTEVEDHFWNVRFKVYQDWKEKQWRRYQKKGYVELLTGFKCQGPMRMNQVINYPVQGTAFHLLLWSFIEVEKWLRENNFTSWLIGQIHDEMVGDFVPEERAQVMAQIHDICCIKLKEHFPWIIVPIEVEASLAPVDTPWNKEQDWNMINDKAA